MVKVVEVQHEPISRGKAYVQAVLNKDAIVVPRYSPDIVNGRWRGIFEEKYSTMKGDDERMLTAMLEAIQASTRITTQRNVYYTVRGMHPDWKYKGMDLKEDKVYGAFTGPLMEKVQLATNHTMQSLGVWAAPRGYIKGDGTITTTTRGVVPLSAMPSLSFDLVDAETTMESQARKVIHFEKDAGFEGLAGEDNAKMIEAIFSTSQGYLVEAANKFLGDCQQKRGMNVYVVHDADPHGIQMQLMYGMSSKSSCYMPSDFYPLPNSAILLGLFPTVAKELGLPAEEVGETHRQIIPNLYKLAEEHPSMQNEVETIDRDNEQWEFQALNGLSPEAPPIYLVEALRVKGDEIKRVPKAEQLKKVILDQIKQRIETYVESYIENFVYEWFNKEGGLKDEIKTKLRELLKDQIKEFTEEANEGYENLKDIDAERFRESVKKKLVEYPKQYWTNAATDIIYDLTNFNFRITAEPEVELKMETAAVDVQAEVNEPDEFDEPLTKNDIVDAIEREIVPDYTIREEIVQKIREALENVLGEPDLEW